MNQCVLSFGLAFAFGILATAAAADTPPITAKWIWHAQSDGPVYNQTVIARKSLPLHKPRQGTMRITADSFYRLSVNGQWVADGPCRCWPEHFQYDVLDVSNYLRDGDNQLEVVARYYGVGDFHKVPKRRGCLAELDAVSADGRRASCITDDSWKIAVAPPG